MFIDDNPAKEIIKQFLPEINVESSNDISDYINILDKSGFLEITTISKDDLNEILLLKQIKKELSLKKLLITKNI